MFKRLAISLKIDFRNKEVFEDLLIKYQIPINSKALIPRKADPYYAEKILKFVIITHL